ncbi:uncharacterized protein LOC113873749 [Abrus precatorius]|uniref:Uncharacterized protein LOC113873749 n=1 Tax=Abrus precatorius TaxID=3816 RepID=A0A8B8MKS0_ABRPR|nr:uncharacterized protein LOC113873749 [Abrus precatorius]
MPHMEHRSTFTICFFLFILILALPSFSEGESKALDSEIYEIDYRGPETHSSVVPPPHHFRGKAYSTRQKGSVTEAKTLGSRSTTYPENKVKKVHGGGL